MASDRFQILVWHSKQTRILRRRLILWLVAFLGVVAAAAAYATSPFEYILTADPTLDPATVVADHRQHWQPLGDATFGFTGKTLWVRGKLPGAGETRLLRIANPLLEHLHVWVDVDGTRVEHDLGIAKPFGERTHPHESDFIIDLPPSRGDVHVLIRANTTSSFRVPITVVGQLQHTAMIQKESTVRGIYYGLIGAMLLYSLVLGPAIGDRTYLIYSAACASMLMLVMTVDGTGYQYIWPNSPWWQSHAICVTAGLMTAAHGLLSIDFLDLERFPQRLRMHRSVVVLSLVASALGLFLVSGWLFAFLIALASFYAPFLLFEASRHVRDQSHAPRYFIAALAALLMGMAMFALRELGVITPNAFFGHALQIGMALDIMLLALALTARFAYERTERDRATAQAQALKVRLEEMQRARELEMREQDLQQSLRHAQQLQVLGQMASGFAHGFNNILTSIIGFTELAMQRASEQHDDTQRRTLNEIHTSGHRAAELVEQLLTYAGGTQTTIARGDLAVVVDRAVTIARPVISTRLRVEWYRPPQNEMAMFDTDQIQQTIVNICLYMRDMSTANGAIVIDIEDYPALEATCASCMRPFSGHYRAVRIRDGQSHVEGDLASIFTPFHTQRPGEAPSLSLAVVHGIMHEHQGHILVTAMTPAGLDFRLCFPEDAHLTRVDQRERTLDA